MPKSSRRKVSFQLYSYVILCGIREDEEILGSSIKLLLLLFLPWGGISPYPSHIPDQTLEVTKDSRALGTPQPQLLLAQVSPRAPSTASMLLLAFAQRCTCSHNLRAHLCQDETHTRLFPNPVSSSFAA